MLFQLALQAAVERGAVGKDSQVTQSEAKTKPHRNRVAANITELGY